MKGKKNRVVFVFDGKRFPFVGGWTLATSTVNRDSVLAVFFNAALSPGRFESINEANLESRKVQVELWINVTLVTICGLLTNVRMDINSEGLVTQVTMCICVE